MRFLKKTCLMGLMSQFLFTISILGAHKLKLNSIVKSKNKFDDKIAQQLVINPYLFDTTLFKNNCIKMRGIHNNFCSEEFNFLNILEIKHKISEIISSKTGFSITNPVYRQLLHYFGGVILDTEKYDLPKAIKKLDEYIITKIQLFPANEIKPITSLSKEKLTDICKAGRSYIKISQFLIVSELVSRIYDNYGQQWNDEYQMKQTEHSNRSLNALQNQGIKIKFDSNHIGLLKNLFLEQDNSSLIEKIKNERFFTINGLRKSKVSLMIHDAFDHFWTFNLLEKKGILKRYESFLNQVGNPHLTDIFCREGELIASVSFDFRYYFLTTHRFEKILTYEEILEILSKNLSTENQKQAYDRLLKEKNNIIFIDYLLRSLSSIYTELMEQRRKFGFIKILNKNFQPIDTLQALDPEYVSLIIDTSLCLIENQTEAFQALLNIVLLGENYLTKIASTSESLPLTVTLEDIENIAYKKITIPYKKIQWIKNNLGTFSVKNKILTC